MTSFVIPAPTQPSVEVADSESRFPIRRVFCVGRNYAAHAREMGKDPTREPPFFFSKPADAVVPASGAVPYPELTENLHHEVELVVAISRDGKDVEPSAALDLVWGYGIGVDLTRRDLQDGQEDEPTVGLGEGVRRLGTVQSAAPSPGNRAPERGAHLAGGERRDPAGGRPSGDDLACGRRDQPCVPRRHGASGRPDLHRHSSRGGGLAAR